MDTPIPRICFISHSYRDAEAVALLKKVLSHDQVTPYFFPPITVRPDEFVSTKLIEAILNHDGLIYLLHGYSGKSFWVAFERDYGQRSRRRVFSFDPQLAEIQLEESRPRDMFVFPSYASKDREHVKRVSEYMSLQRFVNVLDFPLSLKTNDIWRDPKDDIRSLLDRGGYAVLFWSDTAARSSWVRREMEWVWHYKRDRILIALLQDIAFPSWLRDDLPPWLQPVPLFEDTQRSEMNRWDDLIVRLYWLVYNNHELE